MIKPLGSAFRSIWYYYGRGHNFCLDRSTMPMDRIGIFVLYFFISSDFSHVLPLPRVAITPPIVSIVPKQICCHSICIKMNPFCLSNFGPELYR